MEDKIKDLKLENGELWRKLIQLEMSISNLRQEVFELSGQEMEYTFHSQPVGKLSEKEIFKDDDWEGTMKDLFGDALTDDERDYF